MDERLAAELGGAAGTLAALGESGPEVSRLFADRLALHEPPLPWHSNRMRIAELGCALALAAGALAKIGVDVALLAQREVAEVLPPAGGGSSTMPQKRNPVGSALAVACARLVNADAAVLTGGLAQEHERGLGGWHAEWETLPEICTLTAGALAQLTQVVAGLEIHADRMTANLGATQGLIFAEAVSMALATRLGKQKAHELVEHACRLAIEQKCALLDVLARDAQVAANLSRAELENLFDPVASLGLAEQLVDRALKESGDSDG